MKSRLCCHLTVVCILCPTVMLIGTPAHAQTAENPTDATSPAALIAPVGRPAHRSRLLREGLFIVNRLGRIEPSTGGLSPWVFHFDHALNQKALADQPKQQEPALVKLPDMYLLPCRTLQDLQENMKSDERQNGPAAATGPMGRFHNSDPLFDITGQVYVYQGHNYLLPTMIRLVRVQPDKPDAPATSQPAVTANEQIRYDAELRLNQILQRRYDDPMLNTQSDQTPRQLPPPPASVPFRAGKQLREGQLIVNQVGRLVRAPGGLSPWLFTFDADNNGNQRTPMFIMPGRILQTMEQAAGQSDATRFQISGQVFAYRGMNYLLPTMAQQIRSRGNMTPAIASPLSPTAEDNPPPRPTAQP